MFTPEVQGKNLLSLDDISFKFVLSYCHLCWCTKMMKHINSTWVMMNQQTRRLSKMPEEVRAEISPWFIEKHAIKEDAYEKISKLDDKAKYMNSDLKVQILLTQLLLDIHQDLERNADICCLPPAKEKWSGHEPPCKQCKVSKMDARGIIHTKRHLIHFS